MSEKELSDACMVWMRLHAERVYSGSREINAFYAYEAGASWANERAAKRMTELTAERDKARRYCSVAAYDMAGFAETLKESPEAFPRTTHDLMETSEFMQLAGEGREDGTVYDDELSKEKARVAELEAALETSIDGWESCAAYKSASTWGACDDKQEIAKVRAVLSREKHHD